VHDVWVQAATESEGGSMISTATRNETQSETDSLTYQVALRVLGAWLDDQGAAPGIRILETMEGFVVQQSSDHSTGAETSQTLTFDQVWDLDAQKKNRKRSKEKDGGYQNLFRAIGYELDEADAHTILLEQIDDDLLLTYLYPHYVGGFALLKQFTVIGREARREMLRMAQTRRSQGIFATGLSRLIGDV
jgi:hypothetical protein